MIHTPTGTACTRPAAVRCRRCLAAAMASAAPSTLCSAAATRASSSCGEWRNSSKRLSRGQPCRRTSACTGRAWQEMPYDEVAGRQAGRQAATGRRAPKHSNTPKDLPHFGAAARWQRHSGRAGRQAATHVCMLGAHSDAGRRGGHHRRQPEVPIALGAVAVCCVEVHPCRILGARGCIHCHAPLCRQRAEREQGKA
jgi:hypothetical protein